MDTFNEIKKRLNTESKDLLSQFESEYDFWGNIDTVIEGDRGLLKGAEYVEHLFLSFSDLFASKGQYDIDDKYFLDHPLYKKVLGPYFSAINKIEGLRNNIVGEKNDAEAYRDARKESRSRIVGGGFGISGALTGMAAAGAINIGTGLAHSTFNAIGNMFSAISAYSSKSSLYSDSKPILLEGLKQSFENVMLILIDVLKPNVNFNHDREATILKNIDNGSIGESNIKKALLEAFLRYPYDEMAYKIYICHYAEDENDLLVMAKYFGVDISDFLKELHTVNKFHFENLVAANYVRAEFAAICKKIEGNNIIGFTQDVHDNPKYLLYKERGPLIEKLIYIYKNLPAVPDNLSEVQLYRNHYLEIFEKQKEVFLKNQIESGVPENERIGSKEYSEADSILSKYQMLLSGLGMSDDIFIGSEITDELKREALTSYAKGAQKSKIYFIFSCGLDSVPDMLFSSVGLFTGMRKSSFDSPNVIPIDEIKTVEAKKDFIGSSLHVNGEESDFFSSGGTKLKGMECIAKMITELCRYVYEEKRKKDFEICQANLLKDPNDGTSLAHCAIAYFYGSYAKKDIKKATEYLIRGALNNNIQCQYLLGKLIYSDAQSPILDYKKAKFWFNVAYPNCKIQSSKEMFEKELSVLNSKNVQDISEQEVLSGPEYTAILQKMATEKVARPKVKVGGYDVDNLIERARRYEESCDFKSALEYYNKVLDIDVNNTAANTGIKRLQYYEKKFAYYLTASDKDKLILKDNYVIYRKGNGEVKKYEVSTLKDIDATMSTIFFEAPGKFFTESFYCGKRKEAKKWEKLLKDAAAGIYPVRDMKQIIRDNYDKERRSEAIDYCMECTGWGQDKASKVVDSILSYYKY